MNRKIADIIESEEWIASIGREEGLTASAPACDCCSEACDSASDAWCGCSHERGPPVVWVSGLYGHLRMHGYEAATADSLQLLQ